MLRHIRVRSNRLPSSQEHSCLPTDTERRSARSQAAILEAAYELCQEQGYGRLTIEAIARRAGVGKQTIYRWWPSKGAVLLDVFVDAIRAHLATQETGDPLTDLRRRVAATAEVLADNMIGPHVAGLICDALHDPALAEQVAERLAVPARAAHRALLEAARLQGRLRPEVDVDVLADALFAPIWFRLLVRRAPLSSRHAEEVADAVLEGWTTHGDARLRPASSRDREAGDAPS